MVERFNRRLAARLAAQPKTGGNRGKNSFTTHAERNVFIDAFVRDDNNTPLRCLDSLRDDNRGPGLQYADRPALCCIFRDTTSHAIAPAKAGASMRCALSIKAPTFAGATV